MSIFVNTAQAIERLGRLEEGNVQEALVQLSHKSQSVSQASKARTDLLAAQFEAPLKEAVRAVKAVQAVCADRATSLAALSAAKHDLDTKKVCSSAVNNVLLVLWYC